MIFRFDVGMELRGGSGLRAPVRVMRLQALRLGWRSILRFAVIQRSKEGRKTAEHTRLERLAAVPQTDSLPYTV